LRVTIVIFIYLRLKTNRCNAVVGDPVVPLCVPLLPLPG